MIRCELCDKDIQGQHGIGFCINNPSLAERLADDILQAAGSRLSNHTIPETRARILAVAERYLAR